MTRVSYLPPVAMGEINPQILFTQYHGEEIVAYLVKLLRAVTKATTKWTQNTQVAARKGVSENFLAPPGEMVGLCVDGLIAEQFCYKLCLVLSNVAIFCDPDVRDQVSLY